MVHFLYYLKQILSVIVDEEVLDKYFYHFVKLYYAVFKTNRKGINSKKRKRKVIISLTTIPGRIDSVWVTIESLLRQDCKPDGVILWLSQEEFRGKDIPVKLQRQIKRELKIKYCKDIKSYKKLIFTAQEYPDAYIITADDDIIYSEKMVKTLLKEYKKNPGCIICTRSHKIMQRQGRVLPYYRWEKYERRKVIDSAPSYSNFFTSGAGTLIPVFRMNKVMLNEKAFMKLAPTADDVWLNFVAWGSKIKTVNAKGVLGNIISNRENSNNGLYIENVLKQKNDIQIEKVLKYLNINAEDFLSK